MPFYGSAYTMQLCLIDCDIILTAFKISAYLLNHETWNPHLHLQFLPSHDLNDYLCMLKTYYYTYIIYFELLRSDLNVGLVRRGLKFQETQNTGYPMFRCDEDAVVDCPYTRDKITHF